MPKVTVIIPVYNVEKYLRQGLDSVVNQTLKDIEIICVDDCSTDSSLEILKEYMLRDSRIILLRTDKNSGAGAARNKALKIAKGDYVMFLDPDDWYSLDACETAYNQITKYNNDFVMFNYYNYDENTASSKLDTYRTEVFYDANDNFHIELKNYIDYIRISFTWAQIFSREFLLRNNIQFMDLRLCEDVPFFINAVCSAKDISVIQKPLYYYRRNPQSMSLSYERNWKDLFEGRYKSLEIIKNLENSEDFIYPNLIYMIKSLLYWYERIELSNFQIRREFYIELRKFFQKLNSEYDISKIKKYIKYKRFKRICRFSWGLKFFLEKLFSIRNFPDVKKVNFLGMTIKLKRKRK